MIDFIKEAFQVDVYDILIAVVDVFQCLCYRLVGVAVGTKTVAVLAERRVPLLLQGLQNRLLDESIQHRRDAKLAHPAVRLGYLHPLDPELFAPRTWPGDRTWRLGEV